MKTIDASKSIGNADLGNDNWPCLLDVGWSYLDCGDIVAFRREDGSRGIGYVLEKTETMGEWFVTVNEDFRIGGQELVRVNPKNVFIPNGNEPYRHGIRAYAVDDDCMPHPGIVREYDPSDGKGCFLPYGDGDRVCGWILSSRLFVMNEDGDAQCLGAIEDSEPSPLGVRVLKVEPVKKEGSVVAFANVSIGDQFVVNGLKLVKGENGLFVVYPCDPFAKGEEYRSLCNPVTRALRDRIESAVIEAAKTAG